MVKPQFSHFGILRKVDLGDAAKRLREVNDLESMRTELEECHTHWKQERLVADSAVRELKRAYFKSSERESRRIGQDLHDHLCQVLLGAAFSAKALADELGAGSGLRAEAENLGRLINSAVQETRDIVRGLNLVALEPSELGTALDRLSHRPNQKSICRLDKGEPVLVQDAEAALHVYRIVEEAVANAVRHAGASEIVVRFWESDGLIHLQVSDDGKGLDDMQNVVKGLGLRSMRWRAEALGGGLEIENRRVGGTNINCSFPKRK